MESVSSKVLIVDDSLLNVRILSDVLKAFYDVVEAKNGGEAIDICLKEVPDIILLDLVMPDIDGYEVCRRLKSNDKTKDIPIIFLTGLLSPEDETKGFEVGAVDYITKPINIPVLLARVKTHLQLRIEKCKVDQLIRNTLPYAIVDELKSTGKTVPVSFEKVAVLFSDLVDFTRISAKMSPIELITELNEIFTSYDEIIEKNSCERIKTIGDAYMAVGGMHNKDEFYADNIVRSAVEILSHLKSRAVNSKYPWTATLGIDSGEVVGGVVGVKKYIYDIFGSTVNMASRLESASRIYKLELLISDSVYNDIQNPNAFCIREIDTVRVKGEEKVHKLYEVFDCDPENIRIGKNKTLDLFKTGLENYRIGSFSEALDDFNECQKICPEDSLSQLYIKRCSTLKRLPQSENWQGISGI